MTALGMGQARLGGYRPARRWALSQRFLVVGGRGPGGVGAPWLGVGMSHLPREGLPGTRGRRRAEPQSLASVTSENWRLP